VNYRPLCDTWLLARAKLKGGAKYYGAYPGGFPERARALLGATINEPVLHVCGGMARLYPYRGGFGPDDKTLDLDPNVAPDFCQDARKPYPAGFKAILADPPYSGEEAEHYWPGSGAYPSPNLIVKRGLDAVAPGCRVGILHFVLPSPPKEARFVAAVAVLTGYNNRVRVFSVFERTWA